MEPGAFAHFKKTGKYAEGTVLAKELGLVGSTEAVSGIGGWFNERRRTSRSRAATIFLETEKQPQSLIDGLEIRGVHGAEDPRNTSLVHGSDLVDECVGVASQPACPSTIRAAESPLSYNSRSHVTHL